MEQMLLSDPDQYPTAEIIFAHIGKSKSLWLALFDYIQAEHPDFAGEWRFYRDGKSWLMKMTQKKKTIFWLSIIKDAFRTTFYFSDKAEELISASAIPAGMKEQFRDGKHYGKIRGLTIIYANNSDVEAAKELIGIKLSMK
jgi:hypothetical protein